MNDKARKGTESGGNHDGTDAGGEGLEARRRRLEADLARRKPKGEPADDGRATSTAYVQALKLSSEFIAAVALGFALGYGFDHLLGTKPWGMIVFLLLGFCAGVLNVMRVAGIVAQPSVTDGSGAAKAGRPDAAGAVKADRNDRPDGGG